MRSFDEILALAAERKGGEDKVRAAIPVPRSPEALAAIPDDRWLAGMARAVFNAGFNWKVIEAKWPGFEEAFGGFAPGPVSMMSDDGFDALLSDARVVRNGAKLRAVIDNAVFVREVAAEAGGFGRKVGYWPGEDYAGLLDWLKANGARLGGASGQYFLRQMGRDGYVLSRDVVARLVAEGVIDGPPGSKRAMATVQEAFNRWRAESGESLTAISRVLAQSIG